MKQLLRLPLAFLCFLFISHTVTAQTFRRGYVVITEGDTIQGLVKYRDGNLKYKTCIFKKDESSPETAYTTSDIIAYSLTGNAHFERKNISDKKGNEFTAFTEVLVHGKLNLYQYKELLFLAKEKENVQPLRIETEEVSNGERTVIRASTRHLILINSLTLDCPVSESLLVKVQKKLSPQHVTELVNAYNNCISPNSSISYKEAKPWITTEKGILTGAHTAALKFSSGPFSLSDAQFPISTNAIIGGYLNVLTPRKSERVSIHLETFYSQEKHLGYLELSNPTTVHRNDYTINVKRLSLLTMGRYTFETDGLFSPYLGFGFSHNLILNGKGTRRLESATTINNTQHIETTVSETHLYRKFYVAGTAAVGTVYRINDKHKALLQFRYEHGRYVSGTAIPGRTTHLKDHNSYYLTAAYILK